MAVDNLKIHFHLTPRGWVAGTRWYFNKVQGEERSMPEDAVATYEIHIAQQSAFSREERSWQRVWKGSGVSVGRIQALLERFPRPDEDSKLSFE